MTDQNGRKLEEGMTVVYYVEDTGASLVSDNYKPDSELRQVYVVDVSGVLTILSDGAVIPSDQLLII